MAAEQAGSQPAEQTFTVTVPPPGMATPTPQDVGGPTPTPQDDDGGEGEGAKALGAGAGEGDGQGQGQGAGDGKGPDGKAVQGADKGKEGMGDKKPTSSTKPWYEERIKDQAIELRQEKRQREALQKQIDQLRQAQQGQQAQQTQGQQQTPQAPQAPATPPAPQVTEEQVEARARQIASQQAFDAECTAVANKGKAEFSDFEPQMMEYQKIGGLPIPVLEAALELGDDPHRVLYNLSKNLDEALRISKLSPSRMGAALAKLAVAPPPAQPSNAPDPVGRGAGPRGGKAGGGVSTNPDEMTTAQWMEWREKTQRKGRR